jgi:hypothetical protein
MIPRFPAPIRVEYLAVDKWRLLEPFCYYTLTGEHIQVPAGFQTDFASIPRALWALYPPAGPWAGAAVIHDYLYVEGKRTRGECDGIFREAMEALGVPWLRRQIMWLAVRSAGGSSWTKHRLIQREQEAFLLTLRTRKVGKSTFYEKE